jgi:HSP20 family protein
MKSLLPFNWGSTDRNVPSPFSSLQREMDRVFSDFSRQFGEPFGDRALAPKLDIAESDGEITVTAELPGVEQKDVEVTVRDDILTIRGEKKAEKETKEKDYHLVERSYGSFNRVLRLPPGVDAEKVRASIDKGVLTIVLPKAAQSQPKKVEIKPAA